MGFYVYIVYMLLNYVLKHLALSVLFTLVSLTFCYLPSPGLLNGIRS